MLIRPPVVREMRHDLWVKMTKSGHPSPAHPQPTPSDEDAARIAKLRQLGELRASGVLTEDEFTREKARILR